MRNRKRQTQRETETKKGKDRERQRLRDRETNRQTNRQTDRQRQRERQKERTYVCVGSYKDAHTSKKVIYLSISLETYYTYTTSYVIIPYRLIAMITLFNYINDLEQPYIYS